MKEYRYIDGEYEVRSEIKRSVFIATAKGEVDEKGAEEFVKEVRKRYPDATHNCYAYISDALGNTTRFSDDGEPSGTAGQPILDVIKKNGLVKTAVVVTRYFGGIKLGAGGLVGAYSGATSDVVKTAKTGRKQECNRVQICADYSDFSAVDKYVKKAVCKVDNISYGDVVEASILVPSDDVIAFSKGVLEVTAGRAKTVILEDKCFADIGK